MAFLNLVDLHKTYESVRAVDNFNLTVQKGEFISILGPSGCGKTTTLQMIAGFVEPTGGKIFLEGSDLSVIPPNTRGLGIVFQGYALFPHMTAAENVAFGLEMRKVPRATIARQVAKVLDLVGLVGLGGRYPRQMSGGQQQRVALARAIVVRPRMLLLDEPLSGLDAKLREEMHVELRQIQRELGTTTILITHDQHEAMALSDRMVVMNGGRIEQIGEPFSVYERPSSQFVATFLGKNNFFRGESMPAGVRVAGHVIPVAVATQGSINISLRPEKIRIMPSAPGTLPGRITTRIFQGNHWLFHVDTPAGPAIVVRQNDGNPPPKEGEAIGLTWCADDVLIYPAAGKTGP